MNAFNKMTAELFAQVKIEDRKEARRAMKARKRLLRTI